MKTTLSFILVAGCLSLLPATRATGVEREGKRLAYASNLMSHTVSVIDLDSMEWLRDLDLGRYPIFSAIHPHDKTKMILAFHNYDRTEDEDVIAIVDLKTEKILKKVPFPGPGLPSGFVYDRRRDRIYIADENLHKVFVLDGTTLDPIFDLPAGLIPVHVDISPDSRWLVVTNRKSASLYVYDLDNPLGGAKDAIYAVSLGRTPPLSWDSETQPGEAPSSHPLDVKFGGDSRVCYVSDLGTRELLVVDIQTRNVTDRIPLEWPPFDLTLDRDGKRAFVCHVGGDAITIVDLERKSVETVVEGITPNPIHCELDEQHGILIATAWGKDQQGGVHIMDLRTHRILKTILPEGARASIGVTIAP